VRRPVGIVTVQAASRTGDARRERPRFSAWHSTHLSFVEFAAMRRVPECRAGCGSWCTASSLPQRMVDVFISAVRILLNGMPCTSAAASAAGAILVAHHGPRDNPCTPSLRSSCRAPVPQRRTAARWHCRQTALRSLSVPPSRTHQPADVASAAARDVFRCGPWQLSHPKRDPGVRGLRSGCAADHVAHELVVVHCAHASEPTYEAPRMSWAAGVRPLDRDYVLSFRRLRRGRLSRPRFGGGAACGEHRNCRIAKAQVTRIALIIRRTRASSRQAEPTPDPKSMECL